MSEQTLSNIAPKKPALLLLHIISGTFWMSITLVIGNISLTSLSKAMIVSQSVSNE